MGYIWRKRFNLTTALTTYVVPSGNQIVIMNYGDGDIYIDFDQTIDTNESFKLSAGLSLSLNVDIHTLYMQTVSGTSNISIIIKKHKK